MTPMRFRHLNKSYYWIPWGEVQYGHVSGSIVVWFRRRRYIVRKGRI